MADKPLLGIQGLPLVGELVYMFDRISLGLE